MNSVCGNVMSIKVRNFKKEDYPFYKYKNYMIDRYGEPLFRVPIDFGFGCPHRGPDGIGGCTFCCEDGGRAEQTINADTVDAQVRAGIEFARSRYYARKFMAYIQAFTGTFAPASVQRKLYETLLDKYAFDALSIGTRPDCLPLSTIEFLQELANKQEVWVELGVQTTHNRTLQRINRGHDWETSRNAIMELHKAGIMVVVHLMIGLPGESVADNLQTAETIAQLPVDGIKIHNLHIIRGTELAEEYKTEPFHLYDEEEYADILIEILRRLPADMAVMRVNTDTPKERLIAPQWQMSKPVFINYVVRLMNKLAVKQGDLIK